ncbi:YdcF family protein [Deinococcus cellulosilyticus]|uniref:DUF218 domain-containing protein n=1 Tax=Deinococcus cellulosilyticus (strain DSM 18568 / NBRC 106333 / KACC 11606 / 5516J-15) TaxID=1223518 RepID=A0A511N3G6_DEIC1|nr:YdcF family protein [Deinococcus cellulosilyticus]GEM47027.1 hypothetical protein DC3_26620 [Deinococcus cellulosilyticus NBRC 106333 = KACC 11606]
MILKGPEHFLNMQTPFDRADVAFVSGTRFLAPVQKVLPLLESERISQVLLTGGKRGEDGLTEAERHQKFLLEHGISPERILLENQSMTTLENVVYGFAELLKFHGSHSIVNLRSMLVISKWQHSRRVLMQLKCFLPKNIQYFCLTYETDALLGQWQHDPEQRQRVEKEILRIQQFSGTHLLEPEPFGEGWI